MSAAAHVPVLRDRTAELLEPAPGKRIVDGTFGFGGHAGVLLAAGGEVLGLDLDSEAVGACRALASSQPRLRCRQGSFRDLPAALAEAGWDSADGIRLDLGVSSRQLDEPAKGFSYRAEGPLDLRFDDGRGESAADLLARLDEAGIADVIWRFGEERASRRIARALVAARGEAPVTTTSVLREIVAGAVGRGPHLSASLSRVFQALRIAVNDELGALAEALAAAPGCLRPGGRIVVIAYHSLEDRLVKQWLARESRDCLCPPELPACTCGHRRTMRALTRRPVVADADEVAVNPRARSARLRAGERVS